MQLNACTSRKRQQFNSIIFQIYLARARAQCSCSCDITCEYIFMLYAYYFCFLFVSNARGICCIVFKRIQIQPSADDENDNVEKEMWKCM